VLYFDSKKLNYLKTRLVVNDNISYLIINVLKMFTIIFFHCKHKSIIINNNTMSIIGSTSIKNIETAAKDPRISVRQVQFKCGHSGQMQLYLK